MKKSDSLSESKGKGIPQEVREQGDVLSVRQVLCYSEVTVLERKRIRVLLEGVFKRFKTPRAPRVTESNTVREYLRDSRPPAETEALHFLVIMLCYDCRHCDFSM